MHVPDVNTHCRGARAVARAADRLDEIENFDLGGLVNNASRLAALTWAAETPSSFRRASSTFAGQWGQSMPPTRSSISATLSAR
jgi:hypothetical protein